MDFRRTRTTKTALLSTAARSRRRARTMPTFWRMTFAVGILIVAVMVPLLTLGSGHADAVSLPSTPAPSPTVPSVATPAVSTPTISPPSVSTPSVSPSPAGIRSGTPSVTIPSVRTPSVGPVPPVRTPSVGPVPPVRTPSVGSVPSVSAAGGGVGSQSSPSSSSTSVAGPQAGGAAASSSGATPIAVASDRQAAARRAAQRATQRRQQRELRKLVERWGQCLPMLAPQSRRVLLLRAGIGSSHAYTGSEVARLLHITAGREARAEQSAIAELRASGSAGRCGSSSIATLQAPTRDRSVAMGPGLAWSGQAQPVSPVNWGQAASGAQTPGHNQAPSGARTPGGGTTSQTQLGGSDPGTIAIRNAAVGRLTRSSTAGLLLVLFGLALLGVLALLSAAGRRLARREQLAMASASTGPPANGAPSATTTTAPEAAMAEPVAANHAPAAAHAVLAGAAATTASAAGRSAAVAEPGAARAEPSPAPGNGRAIPAAPGSQAATTSESDALRPEVPAGAGAAARSAPVAASGAARNVSPNKEWLRTHRSQIALTLGAAAGGAMRALARGLGRR
jgi:hypothetical protein